MKTTFRLFLSLLLIGTILKPLLGQDTASVRAAEDKDYFYQGHCDYNDPRSMDAYGYFPDQVGNKEIGSWARFGRTSMAKWLGGQIIGVRVGVAAPIKVARVSILDRLAGNKVQTVSTALQTGWNDVFFKQPIPVEEKEVIFGYEYIAADVDQSNPFVISTDRNTEAPADAFFSTFDNANPQSAAFIQGALRVQLIISGPRSMIDNHIQFLRTTHTPAFDSDGNVGIKLRLLNVGANTIHNAEMVCSINGTTVKEIAFSEAFAPLEIKDFFIPGVPAKNGQEVRVMIRSLNGERRIPSPSVIIPISGVLDRVFTRKSLLEQFSTETCSSCPQASQSLKKMMSEGYQDNVIWVVHHDGFKPDPYTLPESKDLYYLYGDDGAYAPAMGLDRTAPELGLEQFQTPVHSVPADLPILKEMFDEAIERPALATVNIAEQCDPKSRKLDITVSGEVLLEHVSANQCYLNILLVEDDIYSTNQKGTGGVPVYLHGVVRAFLTGSKGVPVTLVGNTYNYQTSYTLPNDWTGSKVRIVAFLAKPIGIIENSQIYNAEQSVVSIFSSAEAPVIQEIAPQLYVQDGTIMTPSNAVIETIYNMQGVQLANEMLRPGVYLAKVCTSQGTFVVKIAVP